MPWTKIYANKTEFDRAGGQKAGLRGLTYREALLEAAAELLASDEDVFIMGEGVDDSGGVFGTTLGLRERFGNRVMDTPLAEGALTGIATGAAIAGMRPMLVHMRVDFTLLTMDQIINHAAKWHYMFGGAFKTPLVIRGIIGRGWGSGAQHSQNLHSLFAHIPGLKVVMPANPYDAKGLLRGAVYDGNPVIFIEHRWLYEHIGHVPEGPYAVEIGKGIVRRPGTDVTIVALSLMVSESMQAADALSKDGIEAEVIDLRTLKPFDAPLIMGSVRKTGRLVVADTGWKECGIGAEIISRVAEEAFDSLHGPPVRVNLPECPTPASPALEKLYYPGKDNIIEAVKTALGDATAAR